MSKYRFYTKTGFSPYRVQLKRWWGWKTIYKSDYYDSAIIVLDELRKDEQL